MARRSNIENFSDLLRADMLRKGTYDGPMVRVTSSSAGISRRKLHEVKQATTKKIPARKLRHAMPAPEPHLKRGRKKKAPPIEDHLKTGRAHIKHEWGPEQVSVRASKDAPHSVLKRLVKWGCPTGPHIDFFLADIESLSADLRSPSLEGGGGGGKVSTVSEAKLRAAEDLATLKARIGQGQFDLLLAVLVYGAGPAQLHAEGAEEHIIVKRQIRDAIDALVLFYTPSAVVRNRTWQAAAEYMRKRQGGVDE